MKILANDPQTWIDTRPAPSKRWGSSLVTFCLSTLAAAGMLSLLISSSL
ncbi:MAG: hypothetical protein ACPGMR_06735 [Pontibacterium sp.]